MELANPLMSLSVDIEDSPSQTGTFLSFLLKIATLELHSNSGISFHKPPCSVALEVCKCGWLKEAGFLGWEEPWLSPGGFAFFHTSA